MKIRNNRIYPYPVLYSGSDDYIENTFNVTTGLEYDDDDVTITVSAEIKDECMLNLIESNKVALSCLIDCSYTKYRKDFPIPKEHYDLFEIKIPLSQLVSTIEVTCRLYAKEDITLNMHGSINELYPNENVHFPQYAIIGYADADEYELIKKIDVNGDVPSIFIVTSSETETKLTFDCDSDQIRIYLPAEEYEIYKDYKGESKRIKQMMTIVPVLIEIIENIKKDSSLFGGGWYSVLQDAFAKLGYDDFTSDLFKNKPSIELAQEILGNVEKDAFKEFDILHSRG